MTARRSGIFARLLVVIPLLLPSPLSICKCRLGHECHVAQTSASTVQGTHDSASSPHGCGKCETKSTDNGQTESYGHGCNCMVSPNDSQGLTPQYVQNADPTHEFAFASPMPMASDARYQASYALAMVTEYPPGSKSTPLFQLNSLLRI
jgi:hypothetical protein